jgi:hypothetical protein
MTGSGREGWSGGFTAVRAASSRFAALESTQNFGFEFARTCDLDLYVESRSDLPLVLLRPWACLIGRGHDRKQISSTEPDNNCWLFDLVALFDQARLLVKGSGRSRQPLMEQSSQSQATDRVALFFMRPRAASSRPAHR